MKIHDNTANLIGVALNEAIQMEARRFGTALPR